MSVYWTDLCKYYPEREQSIQPFQEQFKRTNKCHNTLVFELIGSFVSLIDPIDTKTSFGRKDSLITH